jgi:hypothetical protein
MATPDADAHLKIVAAINTTWPGKKWSLAGTDLTTFHWLDVLPAPTVAQLQAAVAALPSQQTVLPQDLMAQLTAADIASVQTVIGGNSSLALLWYSMLAQRDPMMVSNARFMAGWNALVAILGQPRMTAIATALGVTI